jgi:hypothetical protein
MIQLTPLEETVAGRALIEIGQARGEARGELIGIIRMCQKLPGEQRDPRLSPAKNPLEALKRMARELEGHAQSSRG